MKNLFVGMLLGAVLIVGGGLAVAFAQSGVRLFEFVYESGVTPDLAWTVQKVQDDDAICYLFENETENMVSCVAK